MLEISDYKYRAESIEGFIQQIAVSYIPNGYVHYVACSIPPGKDPVAVDKKLAEKYGFAISKWARSRLPEHQARLQYLRFESRFVLLATCGDHLFFSEEPQRKDLRRTSLKVGGYALAAQESQGRLRSNVRLTLTHKGALRRKALELAKGGQSDAVAALLGSPRILMYAGVRKQVWQLLSLANQVLTKGGYSPAELAPTAWRRRQVRVFE